MTEPKQPGTCPHCGATLMFEGQSICHRCAKAIADPASLFRTGAGGSLIGTGLEGTQPKAPWKPDPWPAPPVPVSRLASTSGAATEPGSTPATPVLTDWWRDDSSRGWQGRSSSSTTVKPRSKSPDLSAAMAGFIVICVVVFVAIGAIASLAAPSVDYSEPWAEPTATPVYVVVITPESTAEATTATVETNASGSDQALPTSPAFPAADPLREVGSLAQGRAEHTATRLADGRVAIIGGVSSRWDRDALDSVEINDPATGTFRSGGQLMAPRYGHTATLLKNGRILVTGGIGRQGEYVDQAEIYDPATGTSNPAGTVPGRYRASTALLPDGTVLLVGGRDEDGPAQRVGEFDSKGTYFGETIEPVYGADGSAPVMVKDGQMVIVGGNGENPPAEVLAVYDIEKRDFRTQDVSITGNRPAREEAASCLLMDGKILVAGGMTAIGIDGSIQIIDTGNYLSAVDTGPRPQLIQPRIRHSLTALPDGSALIVGGRDGNGNAIATMERWLPSRNATVAVGTMAAARSDHTATLLADGSVLIVGGRSAGDTFLASAGLYLPS
jgi:hypothetical protein